MFSWLSNKPKSNLPEPTALQAQRTKQIEQLKLFNLNVSEIQRDTEYRVNTVVQNTTLSLYINLPPQFPQDKPLVRVTPPITHPWVSIQGIVTGSPGLNSFVIHSDLGKVIRDIIEEFQRNPPVPNQTVNMQSYPVNPGMSLRGPVSAAYTPVGLGQMPGYMPQVPMPTLPAAGSGPTQHMAPPAYMPAVSTSSAQVMSPLRNSPCGTAYRLPDFPLNFPQLKDLSQTELKELQEDEEKLLQFIQKSGFLQSIASDRQALVEDNEELAKENLSKKPAIEEKKRILLEKYDHLNDLRNKFDEHSQKQDELRQMYDPAIVRNNLQVASMQAEEEAEAVAEQFLDGKMPVDSFGKKYMKVRTLSHLRKAKEEKLTTALVQNRLP